MKSRVFAASGNLFLVALFGLSGCYGAAFIPKSEHHVQRNLRRGLPLKSCSTAPLAIGTDEALISILGTNDMHGSVLPKTTKDGKPLGGMAFWTGAVRAIRDGVSATYGARGGVIAVDGGDQFQGTLLSNYSEGKLMFSLMDEVGYDAIVPGNHDYDFGPEGWLVDQVPAGKTGDSREVIKGLAAKASFPLLSANAYYKNSLKTLGGEPVEVKSVGCASSELIDWSQAKRPEYFKPYVVKEVAGLRVAIIGLDNPTTPETTTAANVSDLCFRSSLEEYKAVRTELEGQADVFVMVIHDGDINESKTLTNLLEGIQKWRPDGVDAIVGGHTHVVNRIERNGVYAIQSGANGERFGRIDLVVNLKSKKVDRSKTRVAAGAFLFRDACDPQIDSFCTAAVKPVLAYDCQVLRESPDVIAKIRVAEEEIRPMVSRVLGSSDTTISKNYDTEGALTNFLTDVFRNASGADIAIINAGGVRTTIEPGVFTYERLFQILPFANHAVLLAPMKTSSLVKIMEMSAKTCGNHGAVQASGIRIDYRRDCKKAVDGEDPTGGIVTMTLDDGTMLYDARDPKNVKITDRDFRVATLDFLETGGSGYVDFKDAPRVKDLGLFRELIADELAKDPRKISATIDGRFRNLNSAGSPKK